MGRVMLLSSYVAGPKKDSLSKRLYGVRIKESY